MEPTFHLRGTPQPTTVRNPQNQYVEDGYTFTVVDNATGVAAKLDIPSSLFTPEYVHERATEELGKITAAMQAFPKPQRQG